MVEKTRRENYKIYSEKDNATFYYKKELVQAAAKFYGWNNLEEIDNPTRFIYHNVLPYRKIKV